MYTQKVMPLKANQRKLNFTTFKNKIETLPRKIAVTTLCLAALSSPLSAKQSIIFDTVGVKPILTKTELISLTKFAACLGVGVAVIGYLIFRNTTKKH